MIEMTEQQVKAMANADVVPPRIVNPETSETYVLLRVDEYERLKDAEYDDSPWTRDELHTLAWNAGKNAGWEDMDEYDDVPEKRSRPVKCISVGGDSGRDRSGVSGFGDTTPDRLRAYKSGSPRVC